MCNLHWCYTICTGVTLFALVLHLNCTALRLSKSREYFFQYYHYYYYYYWNQPLFFRNGFHY